jgi:molybdopterin synthase sulfur carrier subunit
MAIEMLYFAWVRERVGVAEERVDPPAEVTTVAELVDCGRLRAAVDQAFVAFDTPIAGAREIAIFPPVTGG